MFFFINISNISLSFVFVWIFGVVFVVKVVSGLWGDRRFEGDVFE